MTSALILLPTAYLFLPLMLAACQLCVCVVEYFCFVLLLSLYYSYVPCLSIFVMLAWTCFFVWVNIPLYVAFTNSHRSRFCSMPICIFLSLPTAYLNISTADTLPMIACTPQACYPCVLISSHTITHIPLRLDIWIGWIS